ncbi:hypothetical protein JTB14_003211 [Gonioctena quinquepunctata]|nr:hypothetical protein JTB14_003211 [Gonioctena quinquepunctata]
MHTQNSQEEAKLDAMQRAWKFGRGASSSTAFFEEVNETEDLLNLPLQDSWVEAQRSTCEAPAKHLNCDDIDAELFDYQEHLLFKEVQVPAPIKHLKLDASSIGDLPAKYTVCTLEPHQLPVVGDKFTFFGINKEPQGIIEVLALEGPQTEIASSFTKHGIEKRATVEFTGKVEYYETGVGKPMLLSGTVVSVKAKGKARAEIVKVINVSIKKQRCYLLPGIQKIHRRVTVRGQEINDVPTKYTMSGLESYEHPVVGTYVDPRVIPGFSYKVRPNDRKDPLFGGRALKLLSIGMGYAKRLTFQPDSLIEPDNYLWSDNHPDGLGLEPRAVHSGMKFLIKAGDMILGEAQVFRDDHPQSEERMEKINTAKGMAIQKYIHIDVMCRIRLARIGGASTENDECIMRVSGMAVVRKEPRASEARVIRVENVGLDSQLRLLFAYTHTELTFMPKEI